MTVTFYQHISVSVHVKASYCTKLIRNVIQQTVLVLIIYSTNRQLHKIIILLVSDTRKGIGKLLKRQSNM